MAFYREHANKKPPVGNGGAWIGTRLRQNSLVRRRRLEISTSSPEFSTLALVCRTPPLAKSCGRLNPFSTGASGSQDSGAFFIWRNSLKTQAKKIARDMFAAVWQAASMNCGQHRMEEILGQGAAQFFTYFSANIFFNFF